MKKHLVYNPSKQLGKIKDFFIKMKNDDTGCCIIGDWVVKRNIFTIIISFIYDFWDCAPLVLIVVVLAIVSFAWCLTDFLSH